MTGPRFDLAVVPPDEAAHLADGVGRILRRTRHASGLSCDRLAAAAGCSGTMVANLERGARRPRRSLLASIAAVLDPDNDDGAALTDRLAAAAGSSLRPDTPASLRRRARAVARARRVRDRELASALAAQNAHAARVRRATPSPDDLERMSPEQLHRAVRRLLTALDDPTTGTTP